MPSVSSTFTRLSRRTVLDLAHFQVAQLFFEDTVVQGRRTAGDCMGGESHQAHPVVPAVVDKAIDHFFYHIQAAAASFEILGLHAGGNIDREHNIDSLAGGLLEGRPTARPGQGYYDQGQCQYSKGKRNMRQVTGAAGVHPRDGGQIRVTQVPLPLDPPAEINQNKRNKN